MLVTALPKGGVRSPLVAADGGARPDTLLDDWDQGVGRPVLHDDQKGFVCVPIETSEDPGAIPEPSTIELPLAELTFVDLDDMPGTADGCRL